MSFLLLDKTVRQSDFELLVDCHQSPESLHSRAGPDLPRGIKELKVVIGHTVLVGFAQPCIQEDLQVGDGGHRGACDGGGGEGGPADLGDPDFDGGRETLVDVGGEVILEVIPVPCGSAFDRDAGEEGVQVDAGQVFVAGQWRLAVHYEV